MNKPFRVLLFIFLAIFVTLACNIPTKDSTVPEPQSTPDPIFIFLSENDIYLTRQAIVTQMVPYYQTPSNWSTVPQTCYRSMVRISLSYSSSGNGIGGSGSLIAAQKLQSPDGQILYLYHILTANHLPVDEYRTVLNGPSLISFQGDSQVENNTNYLAHTQVKNVYNFTIDMAILTLFSWEPIKEDASSFALGIENIIPGDELVKNKEAYFFSFDYPNGYNQYTISTVINPSKTSVHMQNLEQLSTVEGGSSGGAVCNQSGHLVGIVSERDLENAYRFRMAPNPQDIRDQIQKHIKSIETQIQSKYQLVPIP